MAIKVKKQELPNLASFVSENYQRSYNFQQPLFNNFIEYYKLYRSILDEGKQAYEGRANLFVPYVYSTIESMMPRLIGGKPKIDSTPREPEDLNKALSNTKLTDYQWETMEMKRKLKMWVKQSLLYGTSPLKLYWKKTKDYDGPWADVIDVFDFYIDPNATQDVEPHYIIQRAERMIEELRDNPNYTIPAQLEAEVREEQYKVRRDAILGLTRPKDKDIKSVEIFEYWGLYDFDDGKGEVEALIVTANREHVIRAEPSPFKHGQKPFISIQDINVPDQFWSIGEVEPLQSLQYELNDVRNQRMDNVTMILNRMWLVDKNADVDEEDLVSRAGGVVHCGDINGIRDLSTPDVTTSSYNEETLIKADIQQTSGITDVTKGMGGASVRGQSGIANETATGALLLQEAANERLKYKLDNIEDALKEFGQQLNALNAQFIKTDKVIRILGEEGQKWEKVTPDDIKGAYDIVVEMGSTQSLSRAVRRAEARELIATMAPFAELINMDFFIKNLLRQYDIAEVDEAFAKPQLQPGPSEQSLEQAGGAQGAIFGGTTNRAGNGELRGLSRPIPPGAQRGQ